MSSTNISPTKEEKVILALNHK